MRFSHFFMVKKQKKYFMSFFTKHIGFLFGTTFKVLKVLFKLSNAIHIINFILFFKLCIS